MENCDTVSGARFDLVACQLTIKDLAGQPYFNDVLTYEYPNQKSKD